MIFPTSNSTLFISFVYSDEIELSHSISGSIYSNPLLANFQKSVTCFSRPQKYTICPKFSNPFVGTEWEICPLLLFYTLCKYTKTKKISDKQDCRVLKSLSMSDGCGVENLVFKHMFNKPLSFLLY